MATPVIMPKQGQSVETCIITQWLKSKGEVVKTGDILFSYETDKASFDAESPADGIILDIFYQEGDEVPVLTDVAVIGNAGEVYKPLAQTQAPTQTLTGQSHGTASASSPLAQTPTQTPTQTFRISPRAKNMAEKLDIDTSTITGSGPNGRIIARDIEGAIAKPSDARHTVTKSPAMIQGEYTDTKISNMRRIIARTMHESLSTSAQLTHHMSADARKITALRARFKTESEKSGNTGITINDMVCYAVVKALQKHPAINGHFLADSIRLYKKVHLGIAVDTARGLMVPAVQSAGDLSLPGLSTRLREVADMCRKGNIIPDLLTSGAASFTVSNLGNYGVEMFTPIINLPQIAILGVNTIVYRPADLGNGVFGFIPVIGLSLTYDHRAIDGGPATLFLREIKEQIENFEDR